MAYLTFEILSNGNINWCCNNNSTTRNTIEYRKNGGSWVSITATNDTTTGGVNIAVLSGDVLEFRGDNATYSSSTARYGMFGNGNTTAQFKASGNIMSLINSTDFENLKSFTGTYTFRALFNNCSTLMDVSNLILPATGLTTGSYRFMFQNCSNITTAPKLPATTLVSECYQGMFLGCSKLNNIECLATSITASNCTYQWVSGVTSSGTFIKNPSMNSWGSGINGIPTNWTVQDKQFFYVEPDLLAFKLSGGTQVVSLISETNWSSTTSVPWLNISPSTGESGTTSVSVSVAKTIFDSRAGIITFIDEELDYAVCTVEQGGTDGLVPYKKIFRNENRIN